MSDSLLTLGGLATRPLWVAWQQEDRPDGKPTKMPYAPDGRKARADDPATWGNRAAAEQRAADMPKPYGMGGVGLELATLKDGRSLGGIDFGFLPRRLYRRRPILGRGCRRQFRQLCRGLPLRHRSQAILYLRYRCASQSAGSHGRVQVRAAVQARRRRPSTRYRAAPGQPLLRCDRRLAAR